MALGGDPEVLAGTGRPRWGNMLALNICMPWSMGREPGSMGRAPGSRPAFENMAGLNMGRPAGMLGMLPGLSMPGKAGMPGPCMLGKLGSTGKPENAPGRASQGA